MQTTAKVGFLVVVFVLLLYGAYSLLGKAFAQPKTNTYFADFADAAGTSPGTSVSMSGVKIGAVKSVRLISATTARMALEIDQTVRIPRNSYARIGGQLIGIGSSPIQIVVTGEPIKGYYESGDTIKGVTASVADSFLPEEAKSALRELNLTLQATRKLLANETLEKKIDKLVEQSGVTLEKFGKLATRAEGLIGNASHLMSQNEPAIAGAMHNASLAMADIRKSTQLLSKLIESGKYQDLVMAMLKELNATSVKASDLMTNLSNFVSDPKMQAHMKDTVANVDKMTDSGTRIAANTETISKNGITLSAKAIELADKANAIADEAKAALEKISNFFNRNGSRPNLPKAEVHLDVLRQSDPGHFRADLYGRIDIGKGFLEGGLYNAFESNKAIFEYGAPFGRGADYRAGIYASKPGVGVDFRLAPRVWLRGDLFDVNKPQLNLRTQYDFGSGLVGWVGVERLFDGPAFVAGVGIKR